MPIGGRADQVGHGQGYPGLPATLTQFGTGDYSDPGPTVGAQLAGDIRRVFLQSRKEAWSHLDGYPVPMAHLEGPATGQYVVERAMVSIEMASALWVIVGPPGDHSITRALDYVDNFHTEDQDPPHKWAIFEAFAALRVLPGESLTFVWIADTEDPWAHLQVRAER